MASPSTWLMLIDQWETTATGLVQASHIPFRPSTVLAQLIHSEQRRGGSTKQQRLRSKNAEHLERKLESEVRQHYELESDQACAKWRRLHVYLMDDRRQLLERLEWDAKQLCGPLELTLTMDDENPHDSLSTNQRDVCDDAVEAERQRKLVESEWIHQERFNIQEAFTNQTKKIQADYQAFIDQLDSEFMMERQKIMSQAPNKATQASTASSTTKKKTSQLDRQFKSNAKRNMLVQTAPVVDLRGSELTGEYLSSISPNGTPSPAQGVDMTQQDRQLQELEHRCAAFKQAAEDRLKDGMQWIARQCAHMFSQLDCKEAEAKLVSMLMQQNDDEAAKLLRRVGSITSQLRRAVHSRSGLALPPLPTLTPLPVRPTQITTSMKISECPPRRRSEPIGLKGTRHNVK